MAGTTLTDVIVPELFNPYVVNKTMELSALLNSGIVSNNSEFNSLASQAAPVVQMPFFEDLTGESEQIIEGVVLTDKKITSKKDVAAIFRRAARWSSTDLAAALAGSDPMAAIGSLVAGFWARDMQKEVIAVLNGIFGTIPAVTEPATPAITRLSSNLLDITTSGTSAAKVWSASSFIDAQQLLGDAQGQLTAVVMHSATKALLKKQNLITTERPSMGPDFEAYQGKRVIIDDGCPVADGVYTTYLFGQGAIALGNGSPVGFVPSEIHRDPLKGSGVDTLVTRKTYILHPRGIQFTNAVVEHTEGPSRVEVADPKNWLPVYEPKQIRIVAFKHKLA